MRKFWQGNDPVELLLCLIAALFFVGLMFGIVNLAFVDRALVVRP